MNILGIETSCDDTGVAIVSAQTDGSFKILANIIKSQDHTKTKGVVPEVAARHHAQAIMPALDEALSTAGLTKTDLDCVAVTYGPGLVACLLVGVEAAKTVAVMLNLPMVAVNHMEAHIASTFIEHPHLKFPAVALLASGGHTMLVGMHDFQNFHLIGTTKDDAAGEAFDKVARMLDLPYPGGPAISLLAEQGDRLQYNFPKPMLNSDDFNFSFAGLKTSVLYHIRDHQPLSFQDRADVAASFQESVIEVLVSKTWQAAKLHHAQTVILGGGVSANKALQLRLKMVLQETLPQTQLIIPSPGLFTDNGAMIAVAAAVRALTKDFDNWENIKVDPRLKI